MTAAQMVKLRDLGDWTGGNTPSKANPAFWTDGTVPWVSPKDMKVDEITSSEDRVTQRALNEGRVSLVREGSVLFVTRSGILAHSLPVAVSKVPVTINQDLKALTPRPDVLSKYVAHAVRGASQRVLKECSKHGTTVASIETNALLDFEIPLVGVGEQRRIVAEIDKQFSRIDDAVASLKRVKNNLDRYVAATLAEAFSGRWAGAEADWQPVPLKEVADVQLGQQRAPVHAADLNPIPYIRAANVTWDGLSLSDVKSMGFPNAARYSLTYGDILLAEASGSANEVGKPAIWRNEIPGACYQKTLIRVRCHPDELNFEFAFYFFLHTCVSGQFARLAPGVGILHLTAERMLVWPTVAPPLPIQMSIVSELDRRLSIAREVEAEVDSNLKRARALRQAVLAGCLRAPSERGP